MFHGQKYKGLFPASSPRRFSSIKKPVKQEIEEEKENVELKANGVEIITLKGEKGDKGDTPIKGKDYFTEKEIVAFIREIQGRIEVPEDGYTPEKGKDYFTKEEVQSMVDEVLSQIPTPKDGDPGKDAEIDYVYIMEEIEKKIPKPKVGKPPEHEWNGTLLRFKNPDGTWGQWVDLVGQTTNTQGGGYGLGVLSSPGTFIKEELSGVDNVTTVFTLTHTPVETQPFTLVLNNGFVHETEDFTRSGRTITFLTAPQEGKLYASYYYNY